MDNGSGKGSKHYGLLTLSILIYTSIVLGLVLFVIHPVSISGIVLAQTQPVASKAKKKAEEFAGQREKIERDFLEASRTFDCVARV